MRGPPASPIANALLKNGYPLRVRYVATYIKPPLVALLAVARIRGLDKITDREVETGVKVDLQYLDLVISCENLDAAHRLWEDKVHLSGLRCIQACNSG